METCKSCVYGTSEVFIDPCRWQRGSLWISCVYAANQLTWYEVSGNFLPVFLTDLNLGNDLSLRAAASCFTDAPQQQRWNICLSGCFCLRQPVPALSLMFLTPFFSTFSLPSTFTIYFLTHATFFFFKVTPWCPLSLPGFSRISDPSLPPSVCHSQGRNYLWYSDLSYEYRDVSCDPLHTYAHALSLPFTTHYTLLPSTPDVWGQRKPSHIQSVSNFLPRVKVKHHLCACLFSCI